MDNRFDRLENEIQSIVRGDVVRTSRIVSRVGCIIIASQPFLIGLQIFIDNVSSEERAMLEIVPFADGAHPSDARTSFCFFPSLMCRLGLYRLPSLTIIGQYQRCRQVAYSTSQVLS